jgi:hypothetical protein
MTPGAAPAAPPAVAAAGADRLALVDLLDRVLATGVVITGELTLCIADVDLVRISLRALVSSVGALDGRPDDDREVAA